jgi:UDP-N-acetylglucosamine 2-epimerase (non-hydrolysing)
MRRKVLTILGTRPEIIRLSAVLPKLDKRCEHWVLHTGQNYDPNLHDIFFQQLGLRPPDQQLTSRGSLAQQLAETFVGVEQCLMSVKPDAVLVLGDTNSALAAIVCERHGVPVYHMEAGNRCYDKSVPEEVNRKLIDSVSSLNLPYTELSRQNLLREGVANDRIVVVGNPIGEVIAQQQHRIEASDILQKLNLIPNSYVVATCHRAENVDNPQRLNSIVQALEQISKTLPVIFSCHPKTKQRLSNIEFDSSRITVLEPQGFHDWVKLEQQAKLAITDSGTVQEEMCLFKKPTLTIRHSTERPETVWCGSNIVTGLDTAAILQAFDTALVMPTDWNLPEGYAVSNTSSRVINVLMGNHV